MYVVCIVRYQFSFLDKILTHFRPAFIDLPDLILDVPPLRARTCILASLHYIVDIQHVHVLLKGSGAIKPDERCPVSYYRYHR